ncbi:MAG TPA: hypothetical protein VGC64_04530, partial [Pyrinomonadaceae bacterium]
MRDRSNEMMHDHTRNKARRQDAIRAASSLPEGRLFVERFRAPSLLLRRLGVFGFTLSLMLCALVVSVPAQEARQRSARSLTSEDLLD